MRFLVFFIFSCGGLPTPDELPFVDELDLFALLGVIVLVAFEPSTGEDEDHVAHSNCGPSSANLPSRKTIRVFGDLRKHYIQTPNTNDNNPKTYTLETV